MEKSIEPGEVTAPQFPDEGKLKRTWDLLCRLGSISVSTSKRMWDLDLTQCLQNVFAGLLFALRNNSTSTTNTNTRSLTLPRSNGPNSINYGTAHIGDLNQPSSASSAFLPSSFPTFKDNNNNNNGKKNLIPTDTPNQGNANAAWILPHSQNFVEQKQQQLTGSDNRTLVDLSSVLTALQALLNQQTAPSLRPTGVRFPSKAESSEHGSGSGGGGGSGGVGGSGGSSTFSGGHGNMASNEGSGGGGGEFSSSSSFTSSGGGSVNQQSFMKDSSSSSGGGQLTGTYTSDGRFPRGQVNSGQMMSSGFQQGGANSGQMMGNQGDSRGSGGGGGKMDPGSSPDASMSRPSYIGGTPRFAVNQLGSAPADPSGGAAHMGERALTTGCGMPNSASGIDLQISQMMGDWYEYMFFHRSTADGRQATLAFQPGQSPRNFLYTILFTDYTNMELLYRCDQPNPSAGICDVPYFWVNTRVDPRNMTQETKNAIKSAVDLALSPYCYSTSDFTLTQWINVPTCDPSTSAPDAFTSLIRRLQATLAFRPAKN
ncbi:hypothetical protein BV898_06774 [Hypsibius exemplaris]|uniref:Uncharacterized protein n=1 Tax=Hypsibius exemplaris TaxID=2072580 RepID=A0A1W0WVA5_HYPEX|nr:hypothetical protein BV898_06774 [Hypsibius exemplaris]